ncbi:MAG TPA: DUF5668 domain-containing protein [Bradyrhizobium sp.]|nr:DUF5668 domain-containing protein [Bradyrhizobium sp.]
MRLHLGALILILIGLVFLSINLDLVPVEQLRTLPATWWPVVLIVVGVSAMLRPRRAD